MNGNIRNQTRRLYAMYPEMKLDNLALFAPNIDVREDGTKFGTDPVEKRQKNEINEKPQTNE